MTVRLGIIGSGYMGRLHAGKVPLLRDQGVDVTLAGAADLIEKRARDVSECAGARWTTDYRELLPACDAAIVAVPTLDHFEVVRGCLEAGVDVLVEKPVAATLSEAEALWSLARRDGRVLQVGHLEWFNSAMEVIRDRIRRPRFAEVHRIGPFPDRCTDVDVVRDLMIHDLDILQQVLGEEPEQIAAVGIPVLTDQVDIANARLTFPSGCVANLTASRVSMSPMRKLRFFQSDGYFSVDFLEQSAVAFRREISADGTAPQIQMEKIEVPAGDALLDQLAAFVGAVARHEGSRPAAMESDGLGALRTAIRVLEAMPPFDGFE